MKPWLEQPDISILQHGNLLVGFQQSTPGSFNLADVVLTFFYDSREEVEEKYRKFHHVATTELKVNERYQIYNFFAVDPDGRRIEFQHFLHPLPPY